MKRGSNIRGRRLTLHLGVIEQQYPKYSKRAKAITTGDVGKILEAKYGLFTGFYNANKKFVDDQVAKSLKGALESLLMGQSIDPLGKATGAIETRFKNFIATCQAERIGLPGVPTAAAKAGVSHRLAHPFAKGNPRRPSFRDTGLLMASFKVWGTFK